MKTAQEQTAQSYQAIEANGEIGLWWLPWTSVRKQGKMLAQTS